MKFILTNIFIESSHGVLFCFDLTDPDSFHAIPKWMDACDKFSVINDSGIRVLVGCKSDLEHKRLVKFQDAQDFADQNNMIYIETSSRNATNIDKLFGDAFRKLVILKLPPKPAEALSTLKLIVDNHFNAYLDYVKNNSIGMFSKYTKQPGLGI